MNKSVTHLTEQSVAHLGDCTFPLGAGMNRIQHIVYDSDAPGSGYEDAFDVINNSPKY